MSDWRGNAVVGSCLLMLALAGCSGPIETRSGLMGAVLPAIAAVALKAASGASVGPLAA